MGTRSWPLLQPTDKSCAVFRLFRSRAEKRSATLFPEASAPDGNQNADSPEKRAVPTYFHDAPASRITEKIQRKYTYSAYSSRRSPWRNA